MFVLTSRAKVYLARMTSEKNRALESVITTSVLESLILGRGGITEITEGTVIAEILETVIAITETEIEIAETFETEIAVIIGKEIEKEKETEMMDLELGTMGEKEKETEMIATVTVTETEITEMTNETGKVSVELFLIF